MSQSQHYWNAFCSNTYLQYYPSTICPSITPHSSTFPPRHLLFSKAPPRCSIPHIPLSPRSPSLPLSFSPPLSPLFLSIHTTESLLIICDLLKYIHCHSLSLPLAVPSSSLCPVFCSATSSQYSFPLSWSTFSLFCLSVLQDNLHPPPPLYRKEVTNTHYETLLAGAFAWERDEGERRNLEFCSRSCFVQNHEQQVKSCAILLFKLHKISQICTHRGWGAGDGLGGHWIII